MWVNLLCLYILRTKETYHSFNTPNVLLSCEFNAQYVSFLRIDFLTPNYRYRECTYTVFYLFSSILLFTN